LSNRISKLGLGCWGLGGDAYGSIDDDLSKNIIYKAIDSGINFFDTSPTYGFGKSEERLGKYLPKNDGLIIATKVGMKAHSGTEVPLSFTLKSIEKSIDESLFRLNIESIPLAQLHSPMIDYKILFPDIFETLELISEKGKVKQWGISIAKPNHIANLERDWKWASMEFNFSLIDQRILEYKNYYENYAGILIARTPLNFGFLAKQSNSEFMVKDPKSHLSKWSKIQIEKWDFAAGEMRKLSEKLGRTLTELAIRFTLDTNLVEYSIPGAMNLSELEENINASKALPLSSDEILEIYAVYKNIEINLNLITPFKDVIID
jgi:aryl-alcohol dehydrogenase-like predicted oxidoreductase